jgi:hypothetical protein
MRSFFHVSSFQTGCRTMIVGITCYVEDVVAPHCQTWVQFPSRAQNSWSNAICRSCMCPLMLSSSQTSFPMAGGVELNPPTPTNQICIRGAVAQLGERRLCKAEVAGSTPASSPPYIFEFFVLLIWPRCHTSSHSEQRS